MDKKKKKILESKGYKIGSAEDFLELSKEESEIILPDDADNPVPVHNRNGVDLFLCHDRHYCHVRRAPVNRLWRQMDDV